MASINFTIKYRVRIWVLALRNFKKARKLFKRPVRGTLKIMFGKIPFGIEFKDDHSFNTYDPFKLYDTRSLPYSEFDWNFEGRNVKIIHSERGEAEEVFLGRSYSWLPVKNMNVLDIGANIGDSAIFFALEGAKHVYAFEIVPSTAEICKENVKINNLDNKITVLNVGAGKTGKMKISRDFFSDGSFQAIKNSDGEIEVDILSLQQIVTKTNLEEAVLKIDCEGCEYDIIIDDNIYILKRFSHIIGEFHYGFIPLKKTLEKAGFEVTFTKPQPFYSPANSPKECWVGMFKATLRNKET